MASIAAESNGNSEHTEALYREHGTAVAALCRSLLRDRGEAEDATQQVFLSAHRALLNGTVPREPLAWLLTVARNECYARFRERAAIPVPAGEAADGATADASVHVLRAGELATMWDEVGRMPRAQRDAFLLREIRGLSYGQLATELSLSASSVRSLLLRARTRLRNRLGDVAAGLGGAQWVQTLLRIAGGGEGPSPVPAAAKATAVGLGALALVGGGSVQRAVHQASTPRVHASVHHRAETHARRAAVVAPVAAAPAPSEGRSSAHSHRRHGGSGGSGGSGSHGGSNDTVVSALGGTAESRGDGSTSTTSSGSESSGSGSGDTTTTPTTTSTESSSDGGSNSVTTTTTSSGSGSSGPDSSGSSGSGSSDGSGGHDGGTATDGGSGSD
jgi:RNA polymerase sigma-70 factor (ECF subfamily)